MKRGMRKDSLHLGVCILGQETDCIHMKQRMRQQCRSQADPLASTGRTISMCSAPSSFTVRLQPGSLMELSPMSHTVAFPAHCLGSATVLPPLLPVPRWVFLVSRAKVL